MFCCVVVFFLIKKEWARDKVTYSHSVQCEGYSFSMLCRGKDEKAGLLGRDGEKRNIHGQRDLDFVEKSDDGFLRIVES